MAANLQPRVTQFNTVGASGHRGHRPPLPFQAAPHPGGRGPGDMSSGMMPSMQPARQPMTPGPAPQLPPPPPRAVPHSPRARRKVEISDIRNQNLTDSNARRRLSSYVIIRIERTDSSNKIDDEGYPMKSTWESVSQVEETGMISQYETTRRVRDLQRKNKPIGEEKAELPTLIQRQLEMLQERLQRTELDPRYCYVLIQIESKLRKIEQPPTEHHHKDRKTKTYVVDRRKNKTRSRYERVAVIAYFMRTPRQDQNALRMLQEQETEQMKMQQPPPQMPPTLQPTAPMMMPPPPMPMNTAVDQGGNVRPKPPLIIKVNNSTKRRPKPYQGLPRRASGSLYTDGGDDGWSVEDAGTPPSSIGSTAPPKSRSKQYRQDDRPENFGIEVSRQHTKQEFPPDNYPIRFPARPLTPQKASPIRPATGPTRQEAYCPGHEKVDAPVRLRHPPIAPRIVQGASVRRVSPPETRREMFGDRVGHIEADLGRMWIEDDLRDSRDYRIRRQDNPYAMGDRYRQGGLRTRVDRDGPRHDRYLSEEPVRRWPEDDARAYMESRARGLRRAYC